MILPIQLPRGIHEIQPLEICLDFGHIFGRDSRKGGPTLTLTLDLSQRMGVLAIALLLAVAWEGCHMGPLKINVAMPIWSACWNISVYSKLGLQLGASRLGGVSSPSRPQLMYRFVTNLGPSQPLLIYRH